MKSILNASEKSIMMKVIFNENDVIAENSKVEKSIVRAKCIAKKRDLISMFYVADLSRVHLIKFRRNGCFAMKYPWKYGNII